MDSSLLRPALPASSRLATRTSEHKLVLLRSSASETRDTCVRSHVKSTPVQLGLEEILGTSRDTEATPKALFG